MRTEIHHYKTIEEIKVSQIPNPVNLKEQAAPERTNSRQTIRNVALFDRSQRREREIN
jgi:hypothetical protein